MSWMLNFPYQLRHAVLTRWQVNSSPGVVVWKYPVLHRVLTKSHIILTFDGNEIKIYAMWCELCIQIPFPAVDGSRLSGVGNACVYHIAWCCSLSPSHQPCLPCWHSIRSCASTSEWPCIIGAVDWHWLVTCHRLLRPNNSGISDVIVGL